MYKGNRMVIILAISLAIVLTLFYKTQYNAIADGEAHQLLIVVYGGLVSPDGFSFLQALTFSMPFFVQLLLFSDNLNKETKIAISYIFPRKNTRIKWLLNKFMEICIHSVSFYLIQFIIVLGLSMLWGYHFNFSKVIFTIVLLLITLVSINTLLVMLTAVLSIRNRTSMMFSVFFAVYFAWIFLLPATKELSILHQFLPFSHALLLYHELPANIFSIRNGEAFRSFSLIWVTALYYVLCTGLLLFTSSLWFKKINLLEEN